MTENQIKVNSIKELVNKAQEFAASHGETKIGNSAVNSGEYVFTKNRLVPKAKGRVEIELRGGNNASIELVLEEAEFREKPDRNTELYNKVIQELNKAGIYHHHRKPEEPKLPKKDKNTDDKTKNREYSENNINCQNIQQVKNAIKEYYQKNKEGIDKNSDFSHWISVDEVKLWNSHSEVDKNGNQTDSGPFNEFTISLKEIFKNEKNKEVGEKIRINYKEKPSENPEEIRNYVDWPWGELENYWNSLTKNQNDKQPNSNNNNSPNKVPNTEIEQLKREIQELESNPQISKNNSQIQKELVDKKKRLDELEQGINNTNTSLAIYLSLGTVILLIGGIFIVKLVRKRKRR